MERLSLWSSLVCAKGSRAESEHRSRNERPEVRSWVPGRLAQTVLQLWADHSWMHPMPNKLVRLCMILGGFATLWPPAPGVLLCVPSPEG